LTSQPRLDLFQLATNGSLKRSNAALSAFSTENLILRCVENLQLNLGKLHNNISHFGTLGADNDVMTFDVPWNGRSDRLAISISRAVAGEDSVQFSVGFSR
jgi:hypothetical protein